MTIEMEAANEEYQKFDPISYLKFYYNPQNTLTMQVVSLLAKGLNSLPVKVGNVLNLGSGPTVHIELALRHRADQIFMSDYSKNNNDAVVHWLQAKPDYDWDWMCEILSEEEGCSEAPGKMQATAREIVPAVLEVDIFRTPVIRSVYWKRNKQCEIPKKFNTVISTYCVANICETKEGFHRALKNAIDFVDSKGYLLLAGNLKEEAYKVGDVEYVHEPLELEHVLEGLKENNMTVSSLFTDDTLFTLVSRKI